MPDIPTPAPLGAAGSGPQALDGPPPSPALSPGGPQMSGMAGLAPSMPMMSGQLPPEILNAVVATGSRIHDEITGLVQAVPDLGTELLLIQDLLQKALAKVLAGGGMAPSPTSIGGPSFPGGGMAMGGRP